MIHAFKACDADAVILLEADKWPDERNRDTLLYVATSRARQHLVVVLGEGADELAERLEEHRAARPIVSPRPAAAR